MNSEAQAKLDAILANDPSSITDEDRTFLHARSSYLTKEQREDFGIKGTAPKTEEVQEEEDVEAPKKSKK